MTSASAFELATSLRALLESLSGKSSPRDEQRLVEDLELDSMAQLELMARVDARFGVDLGLRLAEGVVIRTVGELIEAVVGDAVEAALTPSGAVIETFFFGGGRSYGALHHAPDRGRAKRAVVLVHPFAHEYFVAHRCLRELALRLARGGVPTLRFDLGGFGDSWGCLREASVEGWRGEIREAVAELRERAGAREVWCVGLRLGATLIASEASGAEHDVLWDPVARGGEHVRELRELHRRTFGRFSAEGRARDRLLGARVRPGLLDEIGEVELPDAPKSGCSTLLRTRAADPPALAFDRKVPEVLEAGDPWPWGRFHTGMYWPVRSLDVLERRIGEGVL